jgi:hypothetical protein
VASKSSLPPSSQSSGSHTPQASDGKGQPAPHEKFGKNRYIGFHLALYGLEKDEPNLSN